jgi:hypothetical protein
VYFSLFTSIELFRIVHLFRYGVARAEEMGNGNRPLEVLGVNAAIASEQFIDFRSPGQIVDAR